MSRGWVEIGFSLVFLGLVLDRCRLVGGESFLLLREWTVVGFVFQVVGFLVG